MITLPLSFSLVMPVTRSAPVVPSATAPALVAPVGAARLTRSVTLAGIAWSMAAVTLVPVWFVVIANVVLASLTDVGADPAGAALMVSAPGLPETLIWLIGSIEKVTVCCWADASPAPAVRARASAAMERVFVFMGCVLREIVRGARSGAV